MAREAGRDGGRDNRGGGRERDRDGDDLMDKLVTINRVAKVVKGGRRFAFAALVVVGDQKGRVGYGAGKAREVPEAIRKATERAKRGMIRVPMKEGRTLHHDVEGNFGAGHVVLRSAEAGTGIIAGGPMRAVFETLGIGDVVAKSLGSRNPHNMVKATFAALQRCARKASRPRTACGVAGGAAGCACAASQASNSAGACATTSSAMRACWLPQNSAQGPRQRPGRLACNCRCCRRPGTMSILPPSAGIQKLCSTSALASAKKTGRPTGR